ncbi:hypothetical protein [Chryseobacterium indoltheticum]|uniref:hypothetical protein n=1 Tax=Chryseobacterium indoltheticum TaxID=254 RepID=UPI003F491ED9
MIFSGLLLSVAAVVYKRRKRQKQKKHFEDIILKLENKRKENLNVLEQDLNNSETTVAENCQDSSLTLLEETEVELLKKLNIFEKGNAFTAKTLP